MFSMKLYHNRSISGLLKEIRRGISKTLMDKNSYALSKADHISQHTNLEINCHKNISYSWWMQHNNTRALSTLQQTQVEPPQSRSLISKEELTDFVAGFPEIVRELTDVAEIQEVPDVMNRFAKAIQYTPTGKKCRAMILISSYKLLEDPQKLTPENIKLVNILAWCFEMIQTGIMFYDDITDCSETRRGSLCWHRQKEVGLSAINDGIMIQQVIFGLLKKYFMDHPAYVSILESFHEATNKLFFGQNLEFMFIGPNGKPKLETFTMKRYTSLAKHKTSYFCFQLPVTLAMYLVGVYDEEKHRQAKNILWEIGHFFQVENDFLDCFGDPAVTGKIGNDIEVGKCSWLAVMALQMATSAQRKIMEEHYGRPEPESVAIIRRLYEDLCLPDTYAIYTEENFNNIIMQIQQTSIGVPHDLFIKIAEFTFKRERESVSQRPKNTFVIN